MNRFFEKQDHAAIYRLYRPKTPDFVARDIVRYVAEKRPSPLRLAVDVGCGSGQNTFSFAKYFDAVIGTDISSAQVAEAEKELTSNGATTSNVRFAVSSAEDMSAVVADHSVDLVVGSLCFHWFDLPKFYAEVRRVLAPNGVIAAHFQVAWTLCHPTDVERSKRLSELVSAFDQAFCSEFNQSLNVDELVPFYKDLQPFPFEDKVSMEVESKAVIQQSLSHYLGFMTSLSPYQRFKSSKPETVINALVESFKKDVLSGYGYDQSMDPDEAVVHTRSQHYYVMGRVQ